MPETTFGRYRLIRLLARGGMAEVYLAALTGAAGFEKKVALKKVLPLYTDLEEFNQLFQDEARISLSLNHSNIVQMFDFGVQQGEYFLVMEYVDGPDLEKMLLAARKKRHPISIDAVLYIGARVAAAIEYAHSRVDEQGRRLNLVHRDISPPNVLLSVQGEVKITDFGVARYDKRVSRSRAGVVRGKYAYMSPEQLMGETVDARSDLFSFGTVLYQMIAGTNPFLGSTDYQTMERVVAARPESIESHRSDLPRDLVRIVERCLQGNPEQRYPDASELRRDIAALMFNRGVIDDRAVLLDEMWQLFPQQLSRRGVSVPAPGPGAGSLSFGAPRMRAAPDIGGDWGQARSAPAQLGGAESEGSEGDEDLTVPHVGNPDAIPTQPLHGSTGTLDAPPLAPANAVTVHEDIDPFASRPIPPGPRTIESLDTQVAKQTSRANAASRRAAESTADAGAAEGGKKKRRGKATVTVEAPPPAQDEVRTDARMAAVPPDDVDTAGKGLPSVAAAGGAPTAPEAPPSATPRASSPPGPAKPAAKGEISTRPFRAITVESLAPVAVDPLRAPEDVPDLDPDEHAATIPAAAQVPVVAEAHPAPVPPPPAPTPPPPSTARRSVPAAPRPAAHPRRPAPPRPSAGNNWAWSLVVLGVAVALLLLAQGARNRMALREPTPVAASTPTPAVAPIPEPTLPPEPAIAEPTTAPAPLLESTPQPAPDPTPTPTVAGRPAPAAPSASAAGPAKARAGQIPLRIETVPEGAAVSIDGLPRGRAPLTIQADPGSLVELSARLDGFLATTKFVNSSAGTVRVELQPDPRTATGPAKVTITAEPWANVSIDGSATGKLTPYTVELAPGSHTISIVNVEAGWNDAKTIEVRAGQVTTVQFKRAAQ